MISIPVMAEETSASATAADDEVVIADFTKADNSLVKVVPVENVDTEGGVALTNDYVDLDSDQSAKIFVWADGSTTIRPLVSPKKFLVDSEE